MRRANGKEVAACSKRKCIDFIPCSQVDGLHPDWRYIPGPQFFQHRKTGEVRAHGSCIGWYEQFPDDYPPFSLGPDKPPPAVKLLRPAPDALTFFCEGAPLDVQPLPLCHARGRLDARHAQRAEAA